MQLVTSESRYTPKLSFRAIVCVYIYVNGLPKYIISKVKLFADVTSLLSVVSDSKIPASELITTYYLPGLTNGKCPLI